MDQNENDRPLNAKEKRSFNGIAVSVMVILLLIIGVNYSKINSPDADVNTSFYSSDEAREKDYQKGVQCIKTANWHDAGVAFVDLEKDNYKDSKTLYNYAAAQETLAEDEPIVGTEMADHYMKNIPDTYTGLFKEDIIKFKQECKSKKETVAQEEAKKYAPQKIIDSNGKQIWKVYVSSGYFNFTGTYTGTGNFIAKLSDSNQSLVGVLANEIGDFVADKTITVPYKGWYYLEVYGSDGKWTYNWRG